jgi:hypothetical protein
LKDAGLSFLLCLVLVGIAELFSPGFFLLDDVQSHFLPGFEEVGQAWRAGEVPLLSRYSWCAGGLAGEYQYGSFNPLIQLTAVATTWIPSMATRAAVLVGLSAWMASWGSLRLARDFGLKFHLGLALVGVVCLNRYALDIGWRAWLPMGISLAWFPWFWHSLASARLSVPLLVASLALTLTAGWPFVVVASASLGVFYFLLAVRRRQWRRAGLLVAAALCALALSSTSLGLLIEYSQSATRSQRPSWQYRLGVLDGLSYFLPGLSFYSETMECQNLYTSIGWIPCLGILGAWLERRKMSPLWWLALVWFALGVSPSLGGMRFSERWLHYLNPVMGLLGLQWLAARVSDPQHRFRGGTWIAILLGQLLGPALDLGRGHPHRWELGPPALLVLFCWGWNRLTTRRETLLVLGTWAGLLLATSLTPLSWHQFPSARLPVPGLVRPDRTWLALYSWPELQDPRPELVVPVRYGNLCMVERLPMVNGYSPLFTAPLIRAWNFSNAGSLDPTPEKVANIALGSRTGGLMDKLDITGLLLSPQWQPLAPHLLRNQWKLSGSEGLVQCWVRDRASRPLFQPLAQARFCRWGKETAEAALAPDGPPAVRSSDRPEGIYPFATPACREGRSGRNWAEAELSANTSDQPGLIGVRRPWFQGYRAFLGGRELKLYTWNLQYMAVEVPPGSPAGTLQVLYKPRSLKLGLFLAIFGLFGTIALARFAQGSLQSAQEPPMS